ncbi:snaclec CHH-B subunit beta-like [Patiria miniata]|uniref:C-type lectin domain-containing protein n=1 Tax=Patiria miniata TaxID=46514 RepID=A0A914AFD9_PATMI|nr:snaclec CHH-B subunit beta-like [Patiria miniata]
MVRKRFIFGLISLHLIMGCTAGDEMCKASIGGRRGACPSTWIKWGGKCYKAIMVKLTWSEAKKECTKMGGAMVAPRSQEETDFLMTLLPLQSQFWINCNDLKEEGTWKCQDGTDEVEYRNWWTLGEEPNNRRDEDCAVVYLISGEWIDVDCISLYRAMCVRPAPQLHF